MSSKSKQQLKLDNQTNFPNNNNGFITPDKLRNFHVDIIDSFLTQDGLDTLSTELSNEITERISADQSLSTAIAQSGGGEGLSQEISNRISGDQSLSTSISQEASQRISADTSILNKISTDYVPYSGANKSVDLGDHTIAVDGIKLDTFTPYVVQNPGEIGWNSVEGTLDLRLYNATTLQLGQEVHTYGRAVGNILNGNPVQFAGVQGDHILIKTANTIEIEQNPYLFIGIATQNIINGEFGYVTYFGKVNGIYTEDWVSGDEIYFDPILNGLTNVKPNVPNRVIKVGYLIKAQTGGAENGILKVKISYGTKLTDLEDVNGTTPTKGTFPVFQDEGYFDFTTNINDYALVSSLSTEISERQTADLSLTTLISTGLSTELSQRVSADASLSTELATTTLIAKGAQQALSFQNYDAMVNYINSLEEPINESTKVGQSIYINTIDVPDIWISNNVFPIIIPSQYNYISDQQLIDDVNANGGYLQMGFYFISFLETEKVDLTNYVTGIQLSTAISTEMSQRVSADLSIDNSTFKLATLNDTKDFTGFLFGDDINVSYNFTNRTITLTGSDLSYYFNGVKKQLGNNTSWTSTSHTTTAGPWFLSTTDGVNFVWSTSPWSFTNVMVAYVYYTGVNTTTFAIRETHGLMDWRTHQQLHQQMGTYYVSGGGVSSGTIAFNTATDSAITPGFEPALVKDEDLTSNVNGLVEGSYTLMIVNSTTNTSTFSVGNTIPFNFTTGNYIQYNNPTTGGLVNGSVNRYYNVYQIIIPVASDVDSQRYRMIFLQPQKEYTSLSAAQNEDINSLSLGALENISPEFVYFTRITYYTASSNNNSGKVTIPTGGITYIYGNKISQISVSGTAGNDHTALSNLTWTLSGHIGEANKVAGFDANGNAIYVDGGDVSAEASIRLSADQSLSTALSTEISERISADLSLSTAISSGGGGGGTSETFVDITLLSSNWVSNTQTITAVGVTTSNTITIYAPLNRDQYLEYGRCQISATSQGADTLTFTNSENPLFDISLKISYR